jgi:hypothetical protein
MVRRLVSGLPGTLGNVSRLLTANTTFIKGEKRSYSVCRYSMISIRSSSDGSDRSLRFLLAVVEFVSSIGIAGQVGAEFSRSLKGRNIQAQFDRVILLVPEVIFSSPVEVRSEMDSSNLPKYSPLASIQLNSHA